MTIPKNIWFPGLITGVCDKEMVMKAGLRCLYYIGRLHRFLFFQTEMIKTIYAFEEKLGEHRFVIFKIKFAPSRTLTVLYVNVTGGY